MVRDAGFEPVRLLACEAMSVVSRLFVNVRYRVVIIRVARTAIFFQYEPSRTGAKKFCHETSRRTFIEGKK